MSRGWTAGSGTFGTVNRAATTRDVPAMDGNDVRTGVACLAFLVAGCAALANTPAQERTWAAYEVCRTMIPGVQIERVDPDGNYWYWRTSSPYGMGEFNACMQAELARQR